MSSKSTKRLVLTKLLLWSVCLLLRFLSLCVSALCAGAAFLFQLLVACTSSSSSFLRGLGAFFGVLAGVSGIISMALFAHMRNNDSAFTGASSTSLEYGFYLILVGWLFALMASLAFCK